ncbi:hypothetical protein NGR_b18210 (plasmid) [Sinorhizobium fredii NGR234]|uniref:Uncharacterized protein n=1 Tax=Sinorhizobium fredii (strain NBRC 101917 / NGR234) TaxID=394 RepID=C3KLI5_SINFN|nr:hypothetical protein NGR_b18210 [Sinorhizobium fredii NGR234]
MVVNDEGSKPAPRHRLASGVFLVFSEGWLASLRKELALPAKAGGMVHRTIKAAKIGYRRPLRAARRA